MKEPGIGAVGLCEGTLGLPLDIPPEGFPGGIGPFGRCPMFDIPPPLWDWD